MKTLIIYTLIAIFSATTALSHDWYPTECCSATDCAPLPVDKIKFTSEGWTLPNGEFIAKGNERQSKDCSFHWCRYNEDPKTKVIWPTGRKQCFFVPDCST